MQTKKNEIYVGIFVLLALIATLFICVMVTDITSIRSEPTYRIYATFNNVGGLKIRSPVRIGGVIIGQVVSINLDDQTYLPRVAMNIKKRYNHIPDTSSLSICTSGLLGEQYISLNVGFEDCEFGTSILKDGSVIRDTKSAMILEDTIGKFLYNNKYISNRSDNISV